MLAALSILTLCSWAQDPWSDVAQAAGLTVDQVQQVLGPLQKRDSVLAAIARPWEAKPWYQYGPIFLNDERVTLGLAFWSEHEQVLARVSESTGVPPEIIVAIIGVETKYGRIMGSDPVANSLYTLGFYYPKRGAFFRRELGHLARLTQDEGWDLTNLRGSYAGAVGIAQFMPSSYRTWAVDGDGDGHRDLFNSPDDAIASVASYFVAHGWRAGEPILLAPASVGGAAESVDGGLEPTQTWSRLEAEGVVLDHPPKADEPAKLYRFTATGAPEYRVGLTNFYVVTRYNHSRLYARAVVDLAAAIRAERD